MDERMRIYMPWASTEKLKGDYKREPQIRIERLFIGDQTILVTGQNK
jgi:hypothetical protein